MTALLTVVALLTAALSAITGLGGGTILIAAMLAAGLPPVIAVPLHAAVQLVSNSSRCMAYFKHINWPAFGWFLIGAIPTPFLMAPLVAQANPDWIRLGMAGFILLALQPAWIKRIRMHGRSGMIIAGGIAGGIGSVVGASGLLIAPFFLRSQWSKETVIGTLAVAQAAAHLVKVIAFAQLGVNFEQSMAALWWLFVPMAVAVIVGTALGKTLAQYLSDKLFRKVFRVILVSLAIKLTWDGITGLGIF